jgi:PAS domain S-box-containing protein
MTSHPKHDNGNGKSGFQIWRRRKEPVLTGDALQNAIFHSENFSSIATDANGVIQIFNVGAERMLGYAAEDVVNKITPADISDSQEMIARARAEHRGWQRDRSRLRGTGIQGFSRD